VEKRARRTNDRQGDMNGGIILRVLKLCTPFSLGVRASIAGYFEVITQDVFTHV